MAINVTFSTVSAINIRWSDLRAST